MKQFYLLALAATLAFTGCKKDDGGNPLPGTLTIEKTEYALDAVENRTATVAFSAAADWTLSVVYDDAESATEWLTVTPASGTAGEQSAELSAASNFWTSARSAYVDIVCGSQTVRLTVTQTGISDEVDFTELFDPDFAKKLQELGHISDAENITPADMENIAAITSLHVTGTDDASGLTSLQGIEYFESLTYLNCSNNQLTSLDVSANTALTYLDCRYCDLTSLDVSGCTALTYLDCYACDLTSLYINQNTALTYLNCFGCDLTSLDVSNCKELVELDCKSCKLTSLKVDKNTKLKYLDCYNNQLEQLDISGCEELVELTCDENQLTSLDVSNNTKLTYLNCYSNQLLSLDISGSASLVDVQCGDNPMERLDVSNCSALEELNCGGVPITSLDISNCTALTKLYCNYCSLVSLDISDCTNLEELQCSGNQLKELDISKNTKLNELFCGNNPGDGVSAFPLTVWGNNAEQPENLYIYPLEWDYEGVHITIDLRIAE